MENLKYNIPITPDLKVFDLKGSLRGRLVKQDETVLQDRNLLNEMN